MAVEAVVRKIDLPAHEPLGPGTIPFQNFVPLLERVQFAGDLPPQFLGVLHRFAGNALVLFQTLDVGGVAKLRRRLKLAVFLQDESMLV